MKNMTKKFSFSNTFSAGLILFCLGTNVFKCEASLQEDQGGSNSRPTMASSSLSVSTPVSEFVPVVPVLHPIKVPTADELRGNIFWHELVSLQATDPSRKAKGTQGQEAFSAVTDLATLFEDYKNINIISEGESFLDILKKDRCEIKVVINDHEMEIPNFRETLELSIRQWPVLKDCFFSLNQSVVLLRKRILADFTLMQEAYAREIELRTELKVLRDISKSWQGQLKRETETTDEPNQVLAQEKEKFETEKALLESQISQKDEAYKVLADENRRLKEEIGRLKAGTDVAITIHQAIPQRKPGFWAWVWSFFGRSTGENKNF